MAHAMTTEEVKKHVRVYLLVFTSLLLLTIATVAVSYLHLPRPAAIFVGLLVATIKGLLVGLFFMHLSAERRIIYGVLGFTFFFFAFVLAIAFFLK